MARVRWVFFIMAIFVTAAYAMTWVTMRSDDAPLDPLALAGALVLGAWWLRGYHLRTFARWMAPIECAALFAVQLAGDPVLTGPALGIVWAGMCFRGLYGTKKVDAAITMAMFGISSVGSRLFLASTGADVVLLTPAVLTMPALIIALHVLTASTEQVDRAAFRRQAMIRGSSRFLAASDLQSVYDATLETVVDSLQGTGLETVALISAPTAGVSRVVAVGGSAPNLRLGAEADWNSLVAPGRPFYGDIAEPQVQLDESDSAWVRELYGLSPRSGVICVTHLLTRDGPWGLIVVGTPEPLEGDRLEVLRTLARHAAQVLESRGLTEDLKLREARFRSLVQNSSDAITVISTEGLIGYQSPASVRVFGYEPEQLMGRNLRDLVHADYQVELEALLRNVTQERDATATAEWRWRSPDGGWVSIETVVSNLLGDPNVHGLVLNSRNVEDRKRAEEALRVADRQALQAEKLRALGQMASGIAHDLNQSLALISGYVELALRSLDDAEENAMVRESLSVALKATTDGAGSIKRLLTFARTGQGGQVEIVELSRLASDVAQLTAPHWRDAAQAEGRRIRVSVEATGDPLVVGQPDLLREALTNLIFNAVDALPDGGTIRIAAARVGERAELRVSDNGVGMPAEVRERVFEPFFTTKGERGTGLGLVTVFTVVKHLGGEIAVESAPGEGTTFILSFPAAEPTTREAPAETAGPSCGKDVAGLKVRMPKRILVVDDEPALVRMMSLMLGGLGHTVVGAESGEEALQLLSQQPFEVVVSDLGMGTGMSGWDLAGRVRESWPGVGFVLATGWGAGLELGEARARGVEAVVSKPYQLSELEEAIGASAPVAVAQLQ